MDKPIVLIKFLDKKSILFIESHLSDNIINKFKKYNPHCYIQSLFGRLLIAKLANISESNLESFLLDSLNSFYYKKNKLFWSISHKDNWIAAAISNKPIGIDLEINKKIHPDLFNTFTHKEWEILGKRNKLNFYKGWTAKESALKALSLGIKDLNKIVIHQKKGNKIVLLKGRRKIIANVSSNKQLTYSICEAISY